MLRLASRRVAPLYRQQQRVFSKDASGSSLPIPQVTAPLGQGGQWRVVRPGGRSSVSGVVATVFGSTGFVGRYVISTLGRIGSQCIVPYRGDGMNARHLKLAGDLGQIVPVPFDIYDKDSIARAVAKSNVVVNVIGNRFETMNFKYHDTNVKVAHRIAKIAKEAGVERFIHVSALGAHGRSPSALLRSKAEGEEVVKAVYPDATILRPAPVFGHEDRLLNRYADMLNYAPVFPNFGKHLDQELQPVYVLDVAQAVLAAITNPQAPGKTYELGGPDVFTQRQLVEMVRSEIYRDERPIVPIPGFVGRLAASLIEKLPRDNWKSWTNDLLDQAEAPLVVRSSALTLQDLGVKATPIATQAPHILLRHRHARGPSIQGLMTAQHSQRLRANAGQPPRGFSQAGTGSSA